jgi:ATP-dependent RNA helicase DDX35
LFKRPPRLKIIFSKVNVRFITKCSENTKIKFLTEGVLIREMLADPLLMSYSVIVIDEAHERNNLTDCCLGLLKKIAKVSPNRFKNN